MTRFVRLIEDESGAVMIEYGLIAAIVGLVLVTALPALSSVIGSMFANIADLLPD